MACGSSAIWRMDLSDRCEGEVSFRASVLYGCTVRFLIHEGRTVGRSARVCEGDSFLWSDLRYLPFLNSTLVHCLRERYQTLPWYSELATDFDHCRYRELRSEQEGILTYYEQVHEVIL